MDSTAQNKATMGRLREEYKAKHNLVDMNLMQDPTLGRTSNNDTARPLPQESQPDSRRADVLNEVMHAIRLRSVAYCWAHWTANWDSVRRRPRTTIFTS